MRSTSCFPVEKAPGGHVFAGSINQSGAQEVRTERIGPEVHQVIPAAGASTEGVLTAAASAELRSEHPMGKAIVACARAITFARDGARHRSAVNE